MDSTGKETFFRLADPFVSRAVRTNFVFQLPREIDKVFRGEIVPATAVTCPYLSGSKYCDVVWAGLFPLVHERVLEVLTVGGISGWSTYQAQIVDKSGKGISGYHGLSITGRCTTTFCGEGYSEIIYEAGPSGIPMKHYKGITFEGWDGSDLFTAADGKSLHILTTAAVRYLLEKERISNVEFGKTSAFKVLATDSRVGRHP